MAVDLGRLAVPLKAAKYGRAGDLQFLAPGHLAFAFVEAENEGMIRLTGAGLPRRFLTRQDYC